MLLTALYRAGKTHHRRPQKTPKQGNNTAATATTAEVQRQVSRGWPASDISSSHLIEELLAQQNRISQALTAFIKHPLLTRGICHTTNGNHNSTTHSQENPGRQSTADWSILIQSKRRDLTRNGGGQAPGSLHLPKDTCLQEQPVF